MVIFGANPGLVAVIPGGAGIPAAFRLQGFTGQRSIRAIVTQASANFESGMQFLNTLRDVVHVYAFGERPGTLQVGGMAFLGDCVRGYGSGTGAQDVLLYYLNNRAGSTGRPIVFAIGTTAFYGFLIGGNVGVNNPELHVSPFSFTLQTMPYPAGIIP